MRKCGAQMVVTVLGGTASTRQSSPRFTAHASGSGARTPTAELPHACTHLHSRHRHAGNSHPGAWRGLPRFRGGAGVRRSAGPERWPGRPATWLSALFRRLFWASGGCPFPRCLDGLSGGTSPAVGEHHPLSLRLVLGTEVSEGHFPL